MDWEGIIELVIKLVLTIASGLVAVYLIPWLKEKYSAEQLDRIFKMIDKFVAGAEQIAYNYGHNSEWKKNYVETQLQDLGIAINEEINSYIEASVIELHNMQKIAG